MTKKTSIQFSIWCSETKHYYCKTLLKSLLLLLLIMTVEFHCNSQNYVKILFTVNLHSCIHTISTMLSGTRGEKWGSEGPHTNISALDSSCLKICSRVPISWDNQGEFVCAAHVGRSTCSDLSLPQGLSLGSQEQGLAGELIQFPSFVARLYIFLEVFSLMFQIPLQFSGIPLGEPFLF